MKRKEKEKKTKSKEKKTKSKEKKTKSKTILLPIFYPLHIQEGSFVSKHFIKEETKCLKILKKIFLLTY